MEKTNVDLLLNPIVPVDLHTEHRERILVDIKAMHFATGIRRILLCGPGLGTKISGFPSEAQTAQLIGNINYAAEVLSPYGIDVGWWCAPVLTMAKNPFKPGDPDFKGHEFQHITGIKGGQSPFAACPLDKEYQDKLCDFIKRVISATDPFLVLIEDDFRLSYHGPADWGCFCPLHLRQFNERAGTSYDREEMLALFSSEHGAILPLRRTFAEICRESMVEFAVAVRKRVDENNPDLRIGICQSGTCDLDGDNSEALARAFAGKNKPFIRCWGSQYGSDEATTIPEVISHFMYSAASLPDDFEIVHETDTYPHNRFFTSASKLRSLLTLAVCAGAKGSLFYMTQYLDDPLEEKGYLDIMRNYGKQLDALLAESAKRELVGVQLMYRAEQEWARPYRGVCPSYSKSLWAGVLGRLGIPYSCSEQKVKLIGRDFVRTVSDAEVEKLLSGRVLMDGGAAELLSKRGFSEMIGARVKPAAEILCLYEQIDLENPINKGICGSMIYNFAISPAGKEGGGFYILDTVDGAMGLSRFVAPDGKKLDAAFTLFENRLGGKVAITAYALEGNRSSSIFNYRKKEMMRRAIEWLGDEPLPAYVEKAPNVLCQAFKQVGTDDLMVLLINLSSDPVAEFKLTLSKKVAQLFLLTPDGLWRKNTCTVAKAGITLSWKPKRNIGISEPVILKIKHSH